MFTLFFINFASKSCKNVQKKQKKDIWPAFRVPSTQKLVKYPTNESKNFNLIKFFQVPLLCIDVNKRQLFLHCNFRLWIISQTGSNESEIFLCSKTISTFYYFKSYLSVKCLYWSKAKFRPEISFKILKIIFGDHWMNEWMNEFYSLRSHSHFCKWEQLSCFE